MKITDIKKFEDEHGTELPNEKSSELAVVGTLLENPRFISKTDYLKPRMFYNRELACIYHVIEELFNKGISEIDDFLVINQINCNPNFRDIFERCDNIRSMEEFISDIHLVARTSIEEYELLAKKVVELAFKRESYVKLYNLSNYVLESKDDINACNLKLQDEIANFSNTYIIDTNVQLIGEKIDELWQQLVDRRQSGYAGLPSKFDGLNDYFTYENTELIIVGGRAKSGKSMFFLNEALHKVENGVPTAIFDTEMSNSNWFIRALSLLSGVSLYSIKTGRYDDDEARKIEKAKDWLRNKPLYHIYDADWTKDKIFMTAKTLKHKINLGFLIFDYIKVNDTSGVSEKEHNVLGDMTNFLKNNVAGKLDIPVLAGAQMSPKEMRLADSDKINRYASTIAYWIRKSNEEIVRDGKEEGNYKMFVDYNRLGKQMTEDEYVNFVFNGDKATIHQAKKFYHVEGDNMPY